MIQFNELRFSDDLKTMIIDCEVEKEFEDYIFIDNIEIAYYKEVNSAGVPSKSLTVFEDTGDESSQRAHVSVSEASVLAANIGVDSFKNSLFHVIVTCDTKTDMSLNDIQHLISLECGEDVKVTVGYILDWKAVYRKGMSFVNSMLSDCNPCAPTSGFEQFLLNWNGLKLSLQTCDAVMVAKMWDRFLRSEFVHNGSTVSGCGCR